MARIFHCGSSDVGSNSNSTTLCRLSMEPNKFQNRYKCFSHASVYWCWRFSRILLHDLKQKKKKKRKEEGEEKEFPQTRPVGRVLRARNSGSSRRAARLFFQFQISNTDTCINLSSEKHVHLFWHTIRNSYFRISMKTAKWSTSKPSTIGQEETYLLVITWLLRLNISNREHSLTVVLLTRCGRACPHSTFKMPQRINTCCSIDSTNININPVMILCLTSLRLKPWRHNLATSEQPWQKSR